MPKNSPPASVTAAMLVIAFLGTAWVSIGVITVSGAHPAMRLPAPWLLFFGGLMIAAGLVAFGLALLLRRRSRTGLYAALAFLVASALAVIFDQVGWADLIFVAANIIAVILLLKARLWYLRS